MTTTARTITRRIAATINTRATRVRVGNHMSIARRYAFLDSIARRANNGLITAADYLLGIGADRAFVNRYASSFGTKVSKAYAAKFGHKSERHGLAWARGRFWDCFAYETDEMPVLDAAARGYDKTAALIAA